MYNVIKYLLYVFLMDDDEKAKNAYGRECVTHELVASILDITCNCFIQFLYKVKLYVTWLLNVSKVSDKFSFVILKREIRIYIFKFL